MARRRYQQGCLFKRGKRRKVWVARWREDVIRPDGKLARAHRSRVLGLVSEIPSRRQARSLLEEQLRSLNQGRHRPQSTVPFDQFVEQQWKKLVLPTFKLSTQRGYNMVLRKHVSPYFGDWELRDIAKLDVQHFVAVKFDAGLAWQTVRNCWILLSSILDSGPVPPSWVYEHTRPECRDPLPSVKLGKYRRFFRADIFQYLQVKRARRSRRS